MTTAVAPIAGDKKHISPVENQKAIENHKKADKHHETGNHEKTAESTVTAHEHHGLANEAKNERNQTS